MLFLIAFLIGFFGLALLVIGGFQFRGKQVPARAARQIGGILAGLLPAFLLVYAVLHLIDPESGAYGSVVFCILAVIDLGLAVFVLFKVTRPTNEAKGSAGQNP